MNDPRKDPLTQTGDAEQDRLNFRPFLYEVQAAKFTFNALKRVKANAAAAAEMRAKVSAYESKKREKRRAVKYAARFHRQPFGLLKAWEEAGFRAEYARKSRANWERKVRGGKVQSNDERVLEAERQLEEVELNYHSFLRALGPDTPGLTPQHARSAYGVAAARVRAARDKGILDTPRGRRLQDEKEHLWSLYKAFRGRSEASTSVQPSGLAGPSSLAPSVAEQGTPRNPTHSPELPDPGFSS